MTTSEIKPRLRLRRILAVACRLLHIYLSMASFTLVFFFAATGLILNHPHWFSRGQKTEVRRGVVDGAILRTITAGAGDKLAIVEMFRANEHVHGTVTDFLVDNRQIAVAFRAPGYSADAFIDRNTGSYELTEVKNGFVAVVDDLHKGSNAGKVWSGVIDVSAVLLVLVSVTGLVLIWFVCKRRPLRFAELPEKVREVLSRTAFANRSLEQRSTIPYSETLAL